MRLINVDNLHLNLWVPSKNNEIVKAFENSVIDALNRQPTVEAIPIEWIKETIKLAESVQDSKYAEHLRILLEDWREENE